MVYQCTSLLPRSKPVQQNYLHFFKDTKQKNALYRLIRLRLLVKMFLMEIILPPFFQKISNQRMHCKGSLANITSENVFKADHFSGEGNHEYRNSKKKPCFWCSCRFVSCAFILTLRNTYIKIFPAFFCYFSFQATYCFFSKLSIKLLHPALNFEQKEPRLMASPCTSLLLRSKLIQRITILFSKISNQITRSIS